MNASNRPSIFTRIILADRKLATVIMVYTFAIAFLSCLMILFIDNFATQLMNLHDPGVSAGSLVIAVLPVLVVFVAIIGLYVGVTIKLNQFVGPINRLRAHMTAVVRGETTSEIKLRDDDEISGLLKDYNSVIAKFTNNKSA